MTNENGGAAYRGCLSGQRSVRPVIMWIVVLVLAGAAIFAIRYGTGFGGVPAELHELLAHSGEHPRAINDAMKLLLLAEEEQPGRRCQLLAVLLEDSDPQVARGALTLVAEQFEYAAPDERSALERVFAAWFADASVADKVAQLPNTLACACPDGWIVPLTPIDTRWLIAATLTRIDEVRLVAERAAFGPAAADSPVCQRLRYLDGLADECGAVDAIPDLSTEFVGRFPLSHADLAGMLQDSIADVRQAAGRWLAVAGDDRGLPAFSEWLQTRPSSRDAAEELMRTLYGDDWRSRSARGDTARQ